MEKEAVIRKKERKRPLFLPGIQKNAPVIHFLIVGKHSRVARNRLLFHVFGGSKLKYPFGSKFLPDVSPFGSDIMI
mgnify:CR=1 FL=1